MDNMFSDDNRKQDFEGLVFANKKKLWNLCSSFTLGAAWETDDAFQEVLCALWRNWDQLKREDRRQAWMFRVAYHTLLNIKRSNNIPTVPLSQCLINESMGGEVSIDDFDLSFSQMLSSLSRNDQIFIIAVWKGFSFAEIASMLGISIPAARKRHYRALKKLKKLYEQ